MAFYRIIRDPPRSPTKTEYFYKREFCWEFYRVLKRKGLARSVVKKFREVGFTAKTLRKDEAMLALKD